MSGRIESAEAWFVDPRRTIKAMGAGEERRIERLRIFCYRKWDACSDLARG